MNQTLIKKELYKQNPKAEFAFLIGCDKIYSCELIIDGIITEVRFCIPKHEQAESLTDIIDAKLLIRWIKI